MSANPGTQGAREIFGEVTVDSVTGTVTVTGTVSIDPGTLATAAKQDTGNTSLATLAGGVSGAEYQVDVITMPTVTIQDGGNVITVDGTVTAAAQPGVDIGDVTINNAAGASAVNIQDGGNAITIDFAGVAPPIGAGVEATALRVTVATDSTGVLSVDDNGSSLTTDWNGTAPPIGAGVEATALRVTLATDSTGLVSVDDNGGSLTTDWNGTAPPIGAGVEATALRVTVATDSTGVLSIDDNGSSLTVDSAACNPATSFGKTITFVSVAQGAAGTTALVGASVGNLHKLMGACLVGDAAGTVSFTDGTATLCGAMSIAANAGFVLPTGFMPYTVTAATNRPLNLVTVTAKVSGMVAILTEP